MTTNLEDRLRTALRDDAGRAPLARAEWEGPVYVSAGSPRRGWAVPGVAAGLALAVMAVVAVVGAAHRDGGPSSTAPPFLQGGEYPLEPASATSPSRPQGLVNPDSVRAVRPADLDLVVTVFETALVHPGALRMLCVEMGVGVACMNESQRSMVSGDLVDVPGLAQPIGLTVWANVPAGAAYVQFVDADGATRWQRPVDSIAVFRGSGTPPAAMRAFDADGRELEIPSEVAEPSWLTPTDTEAVAVGRAAAEACLSRGGAIWDACVEEGRAAADGAVRARS